MTDEWMSPAKNTELKPCLLEAGQLEKYEQIEKDYNSFIGKHENFTALKLSDEIIIREGTFLQYMYAYLILPNVDDFYNEETIVSISAVIVDLYKYRQKLKGFYGLMEKFYNK
ncbi:MAG: hypothetical protein ABFS35_02175 [Bacteroidota bacterium]